ncbi:cystathionine gamma-synthase family protein [Agarivorans albus]
MSFKGFTTQLVHCDRLAGVEDGAVHAPIHNSVPYGYAATQDLVDVFQGKQVGHAYARQSTPTLDYLQRKIAMLDESVASLVFGTGMAAIGTVFLTLLKAGDHIVASRFLFGNTSSIFGTLKGYGIEVTLVDATSSDAVEQACQANTKMVFVETIANPATQIVDLAGIGKLCEQRGLVYVVDNTLTSSYLFQPKSVGASLIITSLSKYVGGHGNALGGSVSDTGLFDWSAYPNIFEGYRSGDPKMWGINQIKKKGLRDFGGALSSQAAHLLSVGAETMALRMERQCANALALAKVLDEHPKVAKVYYPGLASHPQHQRASELFKHYGALVSFDLVDGINSTEFLDKTNIVINATHLGDNRTLALPVAQTIYFEMGLEARQASGISETMIRCSIGIEDTEDLLKDFEQALASS